MMSDKLEQRIIALEEADKANFAQHEEILLLLKPISDTYQTVGRLAKWIVAFLVFLSVLGGVILTWGKIFIKEK